MTAQKGSAFLLKITNGAEPPVYQTVASLSASVPARLGRIETGSVESLRAEIRPATLRAPGRRHGGARRN